MHFVQYSSFSFICYILIFSVVGGLASRDEMDSYFKEGEYWSYSEPTTIAAAFGNFTEFTRVGRETQLHQTWAEILLCNARVQSKRTALYFHGSPGLGKTYLLRKLFSKQDYPREYAEEVKEVKFLVLDFNRNACSDAIDFKKYFTDRPNLFALSRLYYVNFAVQSELEWSDFLEIVVVPLIRNKLAAPLRKLMMKQLRIARGEGRCVILVDEILKTEELGIDFANRIRSEVCKWMDQGLCNVVLFSSLDANFMIQEITTSGRAVRSVTTLPLLNSTESMSFLNDNIEAVFVDGEGNPVKKAEIFVKQLARASGGHPRSLEYIINHCNRATGSVKTRKIQEIIDYAAGELCSKYREVKHWRQLFYDVLMGKMVNGDDLLVRGDPESESYRSLVMRGVLIDSFEVENPHFIPTVPELYLHRWIKMEKLDAKIRSFLSQILETRYRFTSVDFEIIHSSWEQMMRYVRQGEPKYAKIPLNELYRLELTNGAAPAASCLVDGSSILTYIEYVKGTNIVLRPNAIYKPDGKNNPGWDRLIVLEAFPVPPGSNSSQRYLLPLFIQNKFSEETSTFKLAVADVESSYNHSRTFMDSFIKLGSEFSLISTTDDNFVLLFVAKCNSYKNVVRKSPSNVMFCFEEDLERLYGPTLKGFVSSLQPDLSISLRAPE
jgi:hypothetical protein